MAENQKIDILKDIFGKYQKSGQEYLFFCPKCQHHKQKLSVNIQKNAFKCWICTLKGNSIKRLVRRFGNFQQKNMWDALTGEVDISRAIDEHLFADLMSPNKEEVHEKIDFPTNFISLTNKNLPFSAIEAKKYLRTRGITEEDILRWKIGFCKDGKYGHRIVVPSFDDNGDINYFVARTYKNDFQTYTNPNVSKDIVFNSLFIDWKNDLIIVEGVFDAIKAFNAVPILGSTLNENSKLFQEIVKHDTPVYIALDSDAEEKAFQLIKNLLLYEVELYKIDITGYKDVGEMSKEEFQTRKANAVEINSETYVENMFQWSIK